MKAFSSLVATSICLIAGLFVACNQPFDPRGELDQKPVVFSVLSTDRNAQYVRVERDYMPADYDPLADTSDKSIRDAIVTISDGTRIAQLRDTTVFRIDDTRLMHPTHSFVASPFTPARGGSYTVRVQVKGIGTAVNSVLIPMKPQLDIDAFSMAVLDRPGNYEKNISILLTMTLGYGAQGYRARLYVDYEVLKDGEWVEERVEVPTSFASSGSSDFAYVLYPKLNRRTEGYRVVGNHNNGVYSRTLVEIAYTKYRSARIVFNRVVVQLLQVDQNLYNYYLSTHSYSDPHTTRLDEPSFAGVTGGVGLIGAYALDSLVHILPENFAFDRY